MLRPSADEASGLLRTSQFVTWSLGMVLGGVAQAFGLLLTLAVGLRWLSQNVGWIPDWIASFDFNPAFGIVLGLACILVVLLVTQQLLFAFDAAHRFADIEIIAEDAPPGVTAQIQVLRPRSALTPESARRAPSCLSRFFPKLAHTGIYDRPETPKEIAAWAKTLVSPRVSAVSDEVSQV
jgi:hypothetical protein